jgi:hypothetical protein
MRRLLGSAVLLVLVVVLSVRSKSASGCAVAPPANKPVAIASESAIIVWDEAGKTQHFIRRASFSTEAADFGFLVPTPTQPTFGEAPDEAFKRLAKITAPKVVTKPRPSSGGCGIGCAAAPGAKKGRAPQVEVLDEQRVAGGKAVVLRAREAQALVDWLKQHDYEYSPALAEWAKPYIAKGWVFTAFKIVRDEKEPRGVATRAVRMTFKTERPFFPYREPQSEEPAGAEKKEKDGHMKDRDGRLLRVYFLSSNRAEGALGGKKAEWPGRTAWAGSLNKADRQAVRDLLHLPGNKAPETWWLTEFEDHSSPRPGTDDVFFRRAAKQEEVRRAPHVKYVSRDVPDGLMFYAFVGCLVVSPLVRRWRRKRRGGKD